MNRDAIPLKEGVRKFRRDGGWSLAWGAANHLNLWKPVWNTFTSRRPIGTNIFDRDWDLLVILDACRHDSLAKVADSVSWMGDIERIRSVGSMSPEWMLNTFSEAYRDSIEETAFVSGNLWSHRIFNERFHEHDDHEFGMIREGSPAWEPVRSDTFTYYETVWPVDHQDDRLHSKGHIPHVVVDRAIAVARERSFDRLVVHFPLPHMPLIADALDWRPGDLTIEELMAGPDLVRELEPEEESYDPAKRGEVHREKIHSAYLQNLRLALDYVDVLLQNIDADTAVISADHGEGLGEYGIWGHPFAFPFSPIKTVPWAETTATDERTYEPRFDPLKRNPTEHERTEFLKHMGYL